MTENILVRCVDTLNFRHITEGSLYTVLKEAGDYFVLYNDIEDVVSYPKRGFRVENEFKKDDLVRCVDNRNARSRLTVGKKYTVVSFRPDNLEVVTNDGTNALFFPSRFTKAYPNEPRVHCELIKAWADGARIKETSPKGLITIYEAGEVSPAWNLAWFYEIIEPEPTELEQLRAEVDRLSERLKELEDG